MAARGAELGLGEVVARRVLGWVADFITLQCGRPPPSHSRDLHSSIIAAFHTCHDLLVNFPTLLSDRELLTAVLEITELAMSGSKSRKTHSSRPIVKEDKRQSSVSLRVSNAAQELLSSVLLQVGNISGHKHIISSTVDEEQIASSEKDAPCDPWFQPSHAFKYFFCDNILLAVSKECHMTVEGESIPVTTVIMRGASGKTAWKFQYRSDSSSVIKSSQKTFALRREVEKNNNDVNCTSKQGLKISSELPKVQIKLQVCKIDKSIPTIGKFDSSINTIPYIQHSR